MPRHSPYALSSLTFLLRLNLLFMLCKFNFHRFFVLKLFSVFVTNEIKYLNILFLVYLIFHLYIFQCALFKSNLIWLNGGAEESRTPDLLLARQAL